MVEKGRDRVREFLWFGDPEGAKVRRQLLDLAEIANGLVFFLPRGKSGQELVLVLPKR